MGKLIVYALILLAVAASYGVAYKLGCDHCTDKQLVATLAQREKELAEAKQKVEEAIENAAKEKKEAAEQRQRDQDAQVERQRKEAENRESLRRHFEKALAESAECSKWQKEVVPCPVE